MLRQRANTLRKIAITLDNIIIVTAFMCAYYLRWAAGSVRELRDYVWVLFFVLPCWFVLLNHFKLYESLRLRSSASIIWNIFKVHVVGGMLLAAIIFAISPHSYSRLLFISFLLFSFLLMSIHNMKVSGLHI